MPLNIFLKVEGTTFLISQSSTTPALLFLRATSYSPCHIYFIEKTLEDSHAEVFTVVTCVVYRGGAGGGGGGAGAAGGGGRGVKDGNGGEMLDSLQDSK